MQLEMKFRCGRCGSTRTNECDIMRYTVYHSSPIERKLSEYIPSGWQVHKMFQEYIILCCECEKELRGMVSELSQAMMEAKERRDVAIEDFFAPLARYHDVWKREDGHYSYAESERKA